MGRAAWRIECACDAELVKRTQARRGRGNVDTEGIGVMATVARVAAAAGVSERTILQNAKIHNTFFAEGAENGAGACTILEDKTLYQEALLAPSPVAAIEQISLRKETDPTYSTRDARRDVSAMKTGRTQEARPGD